MNNKKDVKKALKNTIKKLAPSIITAVIATGLGLLSLYTSPVPMIQDFGKMLTIGLIISFTVALFILLSILVIRDDIFYKEKARKKKVKKQNKTFEKVMGKLAKGILKFKYVIIILALLTASVGLYLDQQVGIETDIETFMPQDSQELQDIQELRTIIGSTEQLAIVFSGEDVLIQENLDWILSAQTGLMAEFSDEILSIKSITTVLSQLTELPLTEITVSNLIVNVPESQLKMFINDTHTNGVLLVSIESLEPEVLEEFIDDLNDFLSLQDTDMNVTVTGQAVIDVSMITALTTGRYTITLIGLLLVFLGLLVIYRNPLKALTPLIPISFIVGWSGAFMYTFGLVYTPLTATLGALIIGIGTEFTILVMGRYYEEKEKAENNDEAIITTLKKMGRPIIASALTTIGGFSALVVSDFAILNNFGIMTLINISLALLASIVILPAVLSIQFGIIKKFKTKAK
jgi:hydrophobe/amphiphile efflux-3 (HAE3) family protein